MIADAAPALALAFPFLFSAFMLIVNVAGAFIAERLFAQELNRQQIVLRFGQYAEALSVLVGIPAMAWGVAQLLPGSIEVTLLVTSGGFALAIFGYAVLVGMGTKTWQQLRKGVPRLAGGASWVAIALTLINVAVGASILLGWLATASET